MSLTWDVSKIKDYKTVCWEPCDDGTDRVTLKDKTEAVIFGCLATYIGEITEANWKEWYTRWYVWNSACNGPDWEPELTPEDVRAHIGLSTNVWPKMPPTKWNARLVESMTYPARMALRKVEETPSR